MFEIILMTCVLGCFLLFTPAELSKMTIFNRVFWLCPNYGHADPPLLPPPLKSGGNFMKGAECAE